MGNKNVKDHTIRKISEIGETSTITNKAISMFLLSMYRKRKELPKISILSKQLGVSNAAISKYIKLIEMESYSVLRYIFQLRSEETEDINEETDQNTKEAIELITSSNRILFVGEGLSGTTNYSFNTNLLKLGYCSLWSTTQTDQEYIAKKLTKDDLIIATSMSMDKHWINVLISNTKAKIIVTTASDYTHKNVNKIMKIVSDEDYMQNQFSWRSRMWAVAIYGTICSKLPSKW